MSTYLICDDYFVSDDGEASLLYNRDNMGNNYLDVSFELLEKIYKEAKQVHDNKVDPLEQFVRSNRVDRAEGKLDE